MSSIIRTTDLTKNYWLGEVKVEAVTGVDLEVDEGSFISIMGPSGAGKTSLMHLLGLLDTPTSGEVEIDGRETSSLSERQRAYFRLKKIGFVFQFFSLLSGFKAYENVYLPMLLTGAETSVSVDRAQEVLEMVGLGDRMDHRPDQLSGGQRQRVAIARAIVNEPDIILADEPTSALDTKTSRDIMGVFRDLSEQGRTVVTVNHEEEIGEIADEVVWMEDGIVRERRKNGN